jgi:type IV pilus assembly protein PilC
VSTLTYTYRARDRGGRTSTGELSADSKAAVAAQLRLRGLVVLDVDQKSAAPSVEEIFERLTPVKGRDLAVMSRQLATMVSSGLNILRALHVLEEQTGSKPLRRAIVAVRTDVEAGLALSQAMTKHPRVFNEMFVSMVSAGESSGNLDVVLERVAAQLEKDDNLRRTVKSAMMYPSLIGGFAVLMLIAMVMFVIPIFADMYSDLGGELPALTQAMITASDLMRGYWYVVLIAPFAIAFAFRKWRHSESGGRAWDALKLRIPMKIGDMVRKIAVARFARTLGTLTSSGVPILQALDITARASGNRVISDPMAGVADRVRQGEQLAGPLAEVGVFPTMVTQMLAVGEETGALDTMLQKVADFYDDEVAATVKSLTSILEPIMMLVVGAIVGLVVISMYLPMFKVYELVQ